jgi:hypothetical protein
MIIGLIVPVDSEGFHEQVKQAYLILIHKIEPSLG